MEVEADTAVAVEVAKATTTQVAMAAAVVMGDRNSSRDHHKAAVMAGTEAATGQACASRCSPTRSSGRVCTGKARSSSLRHNLQQHRQHSQQQLPTTNTKPQ
jgi:hypothetical protein